MSYSFATFHSVLYHSLLWPSSQTAAVTSVWNTAVTAAAGHEFYMSMNRIDVNATSTAAAAATESFVSLAPSTGAKDRSLDLIRWELPSSPISAASAATTAAPVVVAKLGDAHPPRSIGGGDLGYMADYAKVRQLHEITRNAPKYRRPHCHVMFELLLLRNLDKCLVRCIRDLPMRRWLCTPNRVASFRKMTDGRLLLWI